MVIRAVVFDVGGVLEHTPDLGVSRLWEDRLGLASGAVHERMRDTWARAKAGALTEAAMLQEVRQLMGLNRAQLDAFMADIWREYLGTPNRDLIAYAQRLRPRYRTAILSNSLPGARQREQAAYDFASVVDEVIYSDEEGVGKPDPRFYALPCARLDVPPHETVFLDNTEQCVIGAREFGMHAISFQDNTQAIAAIEELLHRQ